MNTINKIAFVGDSFCMNANHDDWPGLVANELNAEIIQTGFGGSHLFKAIRAVMPKFYEADIIVMCVTEPFRMYNHHGIPSNMTWVEQMHSTTGNHWKQRHTTAEKLGMPLDKLLEIFNAAYLYYEYIFDNTFAMFSNISYISFFDSLLNEHNKKVIWFPCFKQSFDFVDTSESEPLWWPQGTGNEVTSKNPYTNSQKIFPINAPNAPPSYYYIPTSGPSANIPLHEISLYELKDWPSDKIDWQVKNDDRGNHLSPENHPIMAKLILDIIKNDNFSPDVIKMEDYFTHMDLANTIRVRL